ncbi:MAG: T9SS type A sorting domain-containing protein [Bacteroidota bacterium]
METQLDQVSQSVKYQPQNDWHGQTSTSATTPSTPSVPLGTVTSDAVTSIKIGEASNGYTFTYEHVNLISVEPDAGTNGGSLALIHRQNISTCGGVDPDDNGIYRYSISTDGGMTWNVGPGINSSGTSAMGCYGLGPLNPAYSQRSRHPNALLFLPPDSTKIENLGLVYAGPVLNTSGQGWDGAVLGFADSVAFSTPDVRQEIYPFSGAANHLNVYSLVERVPGEFFYLSLEQLGTTVGSIFINRGIWNSTTNEIDWSIIQTITPNYLDPVNPAVTSLSIGFSPDGMTGFIGMLGDLKGGVDSVYSLIHSKSVDGGLNWSTLEEFNMQDNDELQDSMSFFIFISAQGDTAFLGGEALTTGFAMDMVVDQNGAPHFTVMVGHASFIDTTTLTYNPASYSIFSGIEKYALDITYDSFGDLNMLYLDWQNEFRGEFGDLGNADPAATMTFDNYLQASRSEDGSVVFFSWVDSDPANSNDGNDAPDLKTVAYDVSAGMMTQVTDWTADDGIWASNVLAPHAAPTLLENGTIVTLPVTALSFDLNNALLQTSLWYFSDVAYDRSSDFTQTPHFFYNCKQAPFSNTSSVITPGCGGSDGEIAIVPGGGVAPYTFQWGASANNSTNDTISNLAAGIYEVLITDDKRCKDTISIVLSNPTAPTLTVSGTTDITCAGADNGSATVTATGGGGGETYMWSNGETNATATALPPGTSMVTVTDMNGCSNFTTVTISEPVGISASFTSTDVPCAGEASGSISANAFGGTGNLAFSWDNGSAGSDLSDLLAGTYTGTITDDNGCTATLVATIMEPPALGSSILAFPNAGMDSTNYDGSAVATISGGVEPYFYRWTGPNTYTDSGENVKFISNLCGGDYFLEVTDANGCVYHDTATVGGIECMTTSIFGPVATGINHVSVFPNPNNGTFVLSVELDRRADLAIEVFNSRGQSLIRKMTEGVLQLEESFNLEGQASGIYMVKVTTDRGSVTEKIMKH